MGGYRSPGRLLDELVAVDDCAFIIDASAAIAAPILLTLAIMWVLTSAIFWRENVHLACIC